MSTVRLKPVHIWWLGFLLFLPSCLIWGYFSIVIVTKFRQFGTLDWQGITHVYLPLFAAVFGAGVPLVCLRRLRHLSAKPNLLAFVGYLVFMLAWGLLDVRSEHYQIGGHDYPNGVLVDGHRHYWHLYFTWYFLPYRWIHGYNFD